VARAKRTDRAEARRKYRAYLQAQEDAGIAEDEGSNSSADSERKPARRSYQDSPPLQPGARLGIVAAAKGAYRPAHYIDDIKSLRQVAFKSNAIWPGLVICLVAGVYIGIRFQASDWRSDAVLMALLQFVFIPPLITPMIAGFLAPRATWLAGAIASLIATLTLLVVLGISSIAVRDVSSGQISATPSSSQSAVAAVVASASTSPTALVSPSAAAAASASPSASPSAATTGTATGTTGTSTSDLLTSAFFMILQSLTIGAGVGALSGWYKRFLALTSGPGKPRSPRSGGQRSAQRRRPATTRK
jgi:hypothetical protein